MSYMSDLNDEQKNALTAFKEQLKMTQSDEDSRLEHIPLTGSEE